MFLYQPHAGTQARAEDAGVWEWLVQSSHKALHQPPSNSYSVSPEDALLCTGSASSKAGGDTPGAGPQSSGSCKLKPLLQPPRMIFQEQVKQQLPPWPPQTRQ